MCNKRKKFLLTFLITSIFFIYTAHAISPEDAYKHIGEFQTVCSKVASTYYAIKSKGQPTFINLNKPYPNQIFTIVIWVSDRPNFKGSPEIVYKNKKAYVTGKITTYKNKLQIIVKDPSQIKIK